MPTASPLKSTGGFRLFAVPGFDRLEAGSLSHGIEVKEDTDRDREAGGQLDGLRSDPAGGQFVTAANG
ncbi:hypothetical protein J2847_006574 [Azospirillum agricola]|uniref:hypothetical protein n=1 Tax=Azospirillum agricola TaxID=1720247 RepID=UPI001AE1DF61|nr:hypothetical protein [Azospirillum agricola]MBP2233237.1 hypothetical protein [Azospirillum agricola]